ncbi:hypothetical protein EDC04DRAFT_2681964 [Pisolithus marmoratus]|nr:hypothetical protein EDC04DRAFT_2681964 [Pisolithus marmoratus]
MILPACQWIAFPTTFVITQLLSLHTGLMSRLVVLLKFSWCLACDFAQSSLTRSAIHPPWVFDFSSPFTTVSSKSNPQVTEGCILTHTQVTRSPLPCTLCPSISMFEEHLLEIKTFLDGATHMGEHLKVGIGVRKLQFMWKNLDTNSFGPLSQVTRKRCLMIGNGFFLIPLFHI